MPPVSPQGSRGGLVAAVVVFTVLFVAAAIFAIYFGVQDSKAEDAYTSLNSRFRDIAVDLNNPDVQTLKSMARGDSRLAEPTALAEAIYQRDQLRKIIGSSAEGAATQPADQSTQDEVADAISRAQQAVGQANALLPKAFSALTADNLIESISKLTLVVSDLDKAVAAAQAERNQVRVQADKDSQAAHDAQTQAGAAVDAAKAALQQQVDTANDAVKKAMDEADAVKKTFEDEQHASAAQLDSLDKERVDLTNKLDSLNKDISRLRDRLAGKRVAVEDAIVRRPEGVVVQVVDADTVYINLGQGDQIVPGMTFEVYDKINPLPKLGDGQSDQDLPAGKASLEVTRVLDHGSECHVSHLAPNEQIVQGDKILNLIYDRNVKFNFFVYGDFDVTNGGHPTPAGADFMKELVTQWGGQVATNLNVDTDFVVVGSPPDVPVYSADDLKNPLNEQNLANAKRSADDFDAVVKQAEDLHVPIMNQNKFLYFIGYYDLALR